MDHETSGAQEWALPGYGRATSRARGAAPRLMTTQTRASTQRGPVRSEAAVQRKNTQGQAAQQPSVPPSAPTGRGTFRGIRARGNFGAVRSQPRAAASRNPSRLFKDSPAKSKWRSGAQPTGAVRLPMAFGQFKYEYILWCGKDNSSGKKDPDYPRPPGYTDQVIYLWGDSTQVTAARELIQRLIAKCNVFPDKKKVEWTKINAHSTNKEVDIELKERREVMIQQLKKAPEVQSAFPEQLLFLWPRDGPSLTESLGTQLEALDVIRARFGCHIFVPKDLPDYICALGQSHETMRQIAHLLRTKWSETMANSNIKSKAYVVEPPEINSMRRIVVKKNKHFAKAFLQGDRLHDFQLENWRGRFALIQSKNNARLLSAIEKALRGVVFVRGHLRMRVNIGSFVLDEYRLPADDKPSYGFEEFREMLLHEQTKGRLIPGLSIGQDKLLAKCFKATKLLEPYESTSHSLEHAEPAYSVNFEFLGSNNALLRLEAEFAKSPGAQEYEITQRRWLRPRKSGQSTHKRSPLQLAVIDFERCDWQVEIKSLEFHETSSIDTALKSFSHSIGFQRTATMGDLSAKPQRKVTFPASAPVSKFIEKTAVRYRLKGTKYIFEIARYDEYSRTSTPAFPGQSPATITGHISANPSTSWGASVFDPNWDNLLGEHANLPVGHSARYNPNLDTFFPPKNQPGPEDKYLGFWDFINLIKQVAELLGPEQTSSPDRPQGSANKASGSSSAVPGALNSQVLSNSSSPTIDAKDLAGLLDADLGTLF
ncbi:hypothetical protein MW887_002050 [Aspergillus wentii]|nr:hypothetical protein MW887_002050 [Aspergillus wentii]